MYFLQAEIDAAVKILLSLKAEYKSASGKDWKPAPSGGKKGETKQAGNQSKEKKQASNQSKDVKQASNQSKEAEDLNNRIVAQGGAVRALKEKKAAKVGNKGSS